MKIFRKVQKMYKPIQNKNNYQYIVDQIKQMILQGELKIGDRLPSERELSELYQVSRACVREALKALETIGLLESRHGGGNYIVNHLKDQLTDNLSLVFILDHCKLKDLTSLRYAFELEIMSEIIQKNDPELRQKLLELKDAIYNATTTKEIEELDLSFHTLISSSTDNPLLEYLQTSIHTVYLKSIKFLNASFPEWNYLPLKESQNYQADIIDALLSRDIKNVKKSLAYHYEYNIDENIEDLYEKYINEQKNS